jgi:hypothetical protein
MKINIFLFCAIILSTLHCCGEQLFVGIMETDNYKDLELSVSAFANVTRIEGLNDMLKTKGAQLTSLPEMRGFEPGKRIRIIQTVDPLEPLSGENPANIAILPIRDGGKAIEEMLAAAYKNRTYWRSNINIYDKPHTTNVVPQVAVMQEGMYLLTSRSKSALLWASDNKKILNAAPLKQKGTLRFLLNPQRVAAVVNAKADPRFLKVFNPETILQELESCTAGVTLDPQSLNMTIWAKPLEGTPLTTLAYNLKSPDETLLNAAPRNSFLQSISHCSNTEVWDRFALNLQNQIVPALTKIRDKGLFSGERAQYLAPSPDNKGMLFVQIETLKEGADVLPAISTLDRAVSTDTLVTLKKEGEETEPVRYKVVLKEDDIKKEQDSVYYTVALLFLQHTWLELQVVDNKLITVLGPRGSIADVTKNLNAYKKEITLLREISIRNEDLGKNILCGSQVRILAALRHTASLIPKITSEQLNTLPEPGYGITFGLKKESDENLAVSFQITADEVSALSRVGSDARDLMQKLLVSMLMQRLDDNKDKDNEGKQL